MIPLTIAGYRGPYVEPERVLARPRRRAKPLAVRSSGRCETCGARWTAARRDIQRRFCSRRCWYAFRSKWSKTGSPFEPTVAVDALRGHVKGPDDVLPYRVDWVIVGGESGRGARPFDLAWARSVVAQCRGAGVPVFVKQLGDDPVQTGPDATRLGSIAELRARKGGDPAEWPADLRVREWPR